MVSSSFIAIAYGCFALCPLIAFHSKKPSTGTMQRLGKMASPTSGRHPNTNTATMITTIAAKIAASMMSPLVMAQMKETPVAVSNRGLLPLPQGPLGKQLPNSPR
jgi:hypothetical protein